MKKITILVLHLGYGGIESAVSSLANLMCSDYEIEIISTYKLYEQPAFYLHPKIKVRYLLEDLKPNKGALISSLKHFRFIKAFKECRKAFRILRLRKEKMIDFVKQCESDIIISTRDFHNEILSTYGSEEAIKIGWEHNHHNENYRYAHKIIESTKRLDYLVLVSKELHQFYEKHLEKEYCTSIYIPNFLEKLPKEKATVQSHNIVTVGRLSKEKGHTDLIKVLHLVKEEENFHLDIIGAGPERETIEKTITAYDLRENVTLHGFLNKEQMAPILKQASIFVLPSYTESFGIVLLEAMSYGIPCIAFDSAQGAKEIIEDNWDGYLVQNRDKEQMAKRIVQLLRSPNRRLVMSSNAIKKAKKFTGSQVKKEWVKLFEIEK